MFSLELNLPLPWCLVIQSSVDKTCWKTQYHKHLLKYHPCFVWAGSEQFCCVSRERLDHDQGIEGSAAAQGKEFKASAAEKGSWTVVATVTRSGSCGGGPRGGWVGGGAWKVCWGGQLVVMLILLSFSVCGPWARCSPEFYELLVQLQGSTWKWKYMSTQVSFTRAPSSFTRHSPKWKTAQKLKTSQMSINRWQVECYSLVKKRHLAMWKMSESF